MRRIIAFDHLTADGYFAAEDGKLDWVVPDEELTQSNLRNMAEADTIRFGLRSRDCTCRDIGERIADELADELRHFRDVMKLSALSHQPCPTCSFVGALCP